jgi:DNA-binding NarL/FixJ family response regulator
MLSSPVISPFLLYVDDHKFHGFLHQRLGAKLNPAFHIHPFGNTTSALEYLTGKATVDGCQHDTRPDLAILDYDLGPARGTELLLWLRKTSPLSDIPIVILSIIDSPAVITHCYRLGANYFLAKPSDYDRLIALVNALHACATSRPASYTALTHLAEYRPFLLPMPSSSAHQPADRGRR